MFGMGKIFVIMGKSATGKDTIYKKILEESGFKLLEIVGYTTRPRRKGETDGLEYHFVTEKELRKLEADGRLIELRCYHTVYGDWYYFTAADEGIDLKVNNYIYIVTLAGYEKLCEFFGKDKVVPIYIEVEDKDRLTRAVERESRQKQPNYKEVCRRYLADEADFSEENLERLGITKRYNNDNFRKCINEIMADMNEIII